MRTFTEFFGFYQDPFKRTPDVDFYYPTQMHVDALDTLLYLIHSDEPFAVLTGEPGTGKTITIKKFINELPSNIVSAYILFPNLTPEELFMAILEDFNIQVDKTLTKNALFAKLRDFLVEIGTEGKKAVIIIDEAQNLPNETLEELRLLSNLETEKDKLLKIILAGQPELDEKLNEESLRQLKQRVTLYVKLDNIKEEDIKNYIYSHLEKAGKSHIKIQNSVVKRIGKITKGNPRLINTLMERTIIAAFLDNSRTIDENHLASALSSVNNIMTTAYKGKSGKSLSIAGIAVITCLAVAVGFLGADKIFDFTGKKTPNQVAQNTYNQPVTQKVENTQDTLKYNNMGDNTGVSENYDMKNTQVQNTEDNFNGQIDTNNQNYNTQTDFNGENSPSEYDANNEIVHIEHQNLIQDDVPQEKPKDVYILVNSLNVRTIPSLESARVAEARIGQKYEFVSENSDWVEIRLSQTLTGWVFKQYVSISERP